MTVQTTLIVGISILLTWFLLYPFLHLQQICTENKQTDIRVAVADWTNTLDSLESSNALKKVLEEVDILVRTCNSSSTRSHSDHSKVKVKKKCRSECPSGGALSSSMTPPAVTTSTATASASAAVHLRAEEDPLGLLCSHLVCPSLSYATVTRSTGWALTQLYYELYCVVFKCTALHFTRITHSVLMRFVGDWLTSLFTLHARVTLSLVSSNHVQ